jgi:hypothetical protein
MGDRVREARLNAVLWSSQTYIEYSHKTIIEIRFRRDLPNYRAEYEVRLTRCQYPAPRHQEK